jgi:CRISPR-associated protein Csm1
MKDGGLKMDSRKRAVVIGALLHDIGKVGQRAQRKDELSQETRSRESDICLGDGYSTHLHVLWTDEFFSKCFSDDLKNKIIGEVTFDFNPQNLASFHHKPASSLHRLVQIADHISSGEREETERGDRDDYIKRRLSSIFNKVALKGEPKIPEPYFYNLTQLNLDKDVFPKKKNELDPPDGTQDIEKYRDKYKVLWNGFIDDFKKLRDKTVDRNLEFHLFLNGLYHLLMKYTWCVPSYTNAKEEVDNDISLFDHSRATAAIASCLYDIYRESEVPNSASSSEFLVVEGDISGIQKFLYKLAQPSNVKGVGKILRGRSMFLTLLPIVTANFIAKRLDQSLVNILYAGGGNFQILLPNTEETIDKLNKTVDEIDRWLFNEFRGELGLVVGYVEADRNNLGKEYGDVLERLKIEIENKKSNKFFNRFFRDEMFTIPQSKQICDVCGSLDATRLNPETGESVCDLCHHHRDLGSEIPRSSYLVLTDADKNLRDEAEIDFGIMGKVLFLEKPLADNELKDVNAHWRINSTDDADALLGFKFFGQVVPQANDSIAKDELPGEESEGYEKGDIITFDDLAQITEGDKKLGILRMDVDYLGLIFSIGLSEVVEGEKDDKWKTKGLSISRAAMLSRMLDWFFTGYLNTLCQTVSDDLRDKPTEPEVKKLRSKVDCHYYIVYSGGDDLFVVAPWDEALELAIRLRNDLREFACYNEDVDISGGLALVKAKFPISRSGELAGEIEKKAKKERRSFSAFAEVDRWDEIEKSLEFGRLLEKAIHGSNGKKLPRTFLNRVLESRRVLEDYQPDDPRRLLHVPGLVYSIARNVNRDLKVTWNGESINIKEKLWDQLIQKKKGLEKSGFGIKYALLKTRRR